MDTSSPTIGLPKWSFVVTILVVLMTLLVPVVSHAGLFEDDDARRAILELRKQVEAMTQQLVSTEQLTRKHAERWTTLETTATTEREQSQQLRRSLVDLQSQLDASKSEVAALRGSLELLQRDAAEARRSQKMAEDIAQNVVPKISNFEQRLAKLEPVVTQVNGRDVWVSQDEKREFDTALGSFQAGDFVNSQKQFSEFLASRPRSVYATTALLWLANAQYALRDFNLAIQSYRNFVSREPNHLRAPDALLGIANCQLELKDLRGMKKSLEDLVRLYPQSDAAIASTGRLKALK